MAGILFIISAPSGSGKSTLVSQLRTLVAGLEFSVSYTTRPPRGSEVDGEAYHFTTREEFERMIAAGDFLAEVPRIQVFFLALLAASGTCARRAIRRSGSGAAGRRRAGYRAARTGNAA